VGAAMTGAWLTLVGLLATSARGYLWFTLLAAGFAWLCAALLVRFGDRGVAVGIAIMNGAGVSIVVCLVVERWITTGWPLW
jgi:hypothetical protein